jgi:hypothetical protein
MKLSLFLFVFASPWKATNAFLPLQARAFAPATTKTTTSSSSMNADSDAEHEKVSDYRKSMSQSRNGKARPDEVCTDTVQCLYYCSTIVVRFLFTVYQITVSILSHLTVFLILSFR